MKLPLEAVTQENQTREWQIFKETRINYLHVYTWEQDGWLYRKKMCAVLSELSPKGFGLLPLSWLDGHFCWLLRLTVSIWSRSWLIKSWHAALKCTWGSSGTDLDLVLSEKLSYCGYTMQLLRNVSALPVRNRGPAPLSTETRAELTGLWCNTSLQMRTWSSAWKLLTCCWAHSRYHSSCLVQFLMLFYAK